MLKEKSRDTKQGWLSRDIVNDPALIMMKFLIQYFMIGAITSIQNIILLESVLSRMRYNSSL
jgi:hypothetical protein